MNENDRLLYILKTFSNRTNGKTTENYVLNRLWTILNDLEIEPVTQYFVKDVGYLIDLYFPNLELGIEVDEIQHAKNKDKDDERENKIKQVIPGYKSIHIKTYKEEISSLEKVEYLSIQELNIEIEKAVKEVQDRKKDFIAKGLFKSWSISIYDLLNANNDILKVEQRFPFSSIKEINEIFKISTQHYFVKTPNNKYIIWSPSISKKSNEWENKIVDKIWFTVSSSVLVEEELPRLIFFKSNDIFQGQKLNAYYFIGKYVFDIEKTLEMNSTNLEFENIVRNKSVKDAKLSQKIKKYYKLIATEIKVD